MGIVHIMKRGGDDLYEYKKALKMAKKGIELLCELSDEMEDEYGDSKYYRREDRDDSDSLYERMGMRRVR